MQKLAAVCAVLLGLPLFAFGANFFVHLYALPVEPSPGDGLLQALRDARLLDFIAASHVATALLLWLPQTRRLGALLQLPMTLGLGAFHFTLSPTGIPWAAALLALNVGALAEPLFAAQKLAAQRSERGGRHLALDA